MQLKQFALATQTCRDIRGFNIKYPDLYQELLHATDYLPSTATVKQRLWHIIHETPVPKCKICNKNNVTWNKNKQCYNEYCDISCRNKDPQFQAFCKQQIFKKYNVKNVMCVEQFKLKQRDTTKNNYGVEYISHLKSMIENKKQRYLEKYGVDNPRKNPIVKQKIKQTILEKYGTINYNDSEEKKNRSIQTCNDRYGCNNFSQRHLSKEILQKLNDPQWLFEQHHIKQRTLTDIAKELGVFCSTVAYKFDELQINKLIFNTTQPQREIVEFLKQHNFNNIIVNDRQTIKPKELDIFLPDLNVAIEYCGLYWHSDSHPRASKWYHFNKYKECKDKGIRLLTIFEDEWLYSKDIVKQKILNILGSNNKEKLHARKTTIVEIDDLTTCQEFFNKNHIQGPPNNFTFNVGLLHEEKIVALCSFLKRGNQYEITRFATNKIVRGGFSKIISYVRKKLSPGTIIFTFADKRWSEGELYLKTGFTLVKELPPDYSYIEGTKRVHKFNYRHKYLTKKLHNYDSNLSESENTIKHNIRRIWNCGLYKFQLIT